MVQCLAVFVLPRFLPPSLLDSNKCIKALVMPKNKNRISEEYQASCGLTRTRGLRKGLTSPQLSLEKC